MSIDDEKKHAQSAGFEPARAEPNGFLVHRLNHSATTAMKIACLKCAVNIALSSVYSSVSAENFTLTRNCAKNKDTLLYSIRFETRRL